MGHVVLCAGVLLSDSCGAVCMYLLSNLCAVCRCFV